MNATKKNQRYHWDRSLKYLKIAHAFEDLFTHMRKNGIILPIPISSFIFNKGVPIDFPPERYFMELFYVLVESSDGISQKIILAPILGPTNYSVEFEVNDFHALYERVVWLATNNINFRQEELLVENLECTADRCISCA